MDVDLCRLDGFVTEPKGDYRLVDAILQQLHRGAVPEDVGTDALARERWARCRGCLTMLADEMLERITAQPVTPHRWEQRIVPRPAPFLEPAFQHTDSVAAQRGAAFLSALAVAAQMRTLAENDIPAVQIDQLRCPETGLERD